MNAPAQNPLKNTVNLYTQELRPVYQRFTLALTVKVIGGWLLLLGLIALALGFVADQYQEQVDILAKTVQSQRTQVTELTEQLRSRTVDPELQQALASTRETTAQLNRLLRTLSAQQTQHQTSFAVLLSDLADIARDDLWLRHIRLDGGDLKLQGYATKAAALPRWMADFNGKTTLQNRQFAVFELRDEPMEENNGLAFTLSSAADDNATAPTPPQQQPLPLNLQGQL